MQVTITVPEQLAAEAAAQGIALDAYIEEVLARQVQPLFQGTERSQAVEQMRQFGKKRGCTLGGLKLKDLLHEGHKH